MSTNFYATIGTYSTNLTISNGNKTASSSNASAYDACHSDLGKSSGKWYWEVTIDSVTTSSTVGICDASQSLAAELGLDTHGYGWESSGLIYYNNSSNATSSYVANDVLGFALDLDNGKLWTRKNGTWTQGDPETDTNPLVTGIAASTWYVALSLSQAQATINFGASAFANAAPTGFSSGFYTLQYHISGTVKENGTGVVRTVRAYRRDNGEFLQEQTSASNGTYTFDLFYSGEVYVIALDDASGTSFNALIFDKVTPS